MLIQLQDGSKFDPVSKKVIDEAPSVDNTLGALPTPAPRKDTKLEDLPAPPNVMSIVCAIIGYRLLGLNKNDIALALNCSDQQLDEVINGDVYDTSYNQVIEAFIRGQENSARDIIARASLDAAHTIVKIASHSKNETNKLKAAERILNTMNITGDENHGMGGVGLTIKIIKDTKNDQISITL
jgi:hypothetical protein